MVYERRERTDQSVGAVLVTGTVRAACPSLCVAASARLLRPPGDDVGQADLTHGSTWNGIGLAMGGLRTRPA
jgi:hypothetical protein